MLVDDVGSAMYYINMKRRGFLLRTYPLWVVKPQRADHVSEE